MKTQNSSHLTVDTLTLSEFAQKIQVNLPIDTVENFHLFEEKLKEPEIMEIFKKQLTFIDKGPTITMALTNILKRFMTRNLAMQCNMSLSRNNKEVVKDTLFVKTVVEYITAWLNRNTKEGEPMISSKVVSSSFGIVFTGSKDWDGYRLKRTTTQN